jgi:hypothetical protein
MLTTLCHYAECRYAECRILFIDIMNVVMLSVVMLSVVMLSVIMLSVVMLSVIMLSVVMQNVIMLRVVAPLQIIQWDSIDNVLCVSTLEMAADKKVFVKTAWLKVVNLDLPDTSSILGPIAKGAETFSKRQLAEQHSAE